MTVRMQLGAMTFEASGSVAEIDQYYAKWAALVTLVLAQQGEALRDAILTKVAQTAGMTEQ